MRRNFLIESDKYPKNRLVFIFFSIVIIFFIYSSRILYLSLYNQKNDTYWNPNRAGKNEDRVNILDRNNIILATDLKRYDFYLNKDLIVNPNTTIDNIAKILPNLDKKSIRSKLIDSKSKQKLILIRKNITKNQKEEIQNNVFGFEFEESSARVYPHENLFSHIIGYTNTDNKGIEGIELQYDKYLSNKENKPLKLTLDIKIQNILRVELEKGLEKYKAKAIWGVVAEVETGKILALVNLPDFNPNQLNNSTEIQRTNNAMQGIYEMGSIFKVFTVAMALDENIIKETDQFDSSLKIDLGNYIIKQDVWSKKMLTPKEILQKSSNVGSALIGMKIGANKMKEFYKKIGFFNKLPIKFSLPEPQYPKSWKQANVATISYGYGIAVSPLHVIMGISGIVYGGIMHTPYFVEGEEYATTEIITPETSQIMNEYLRNVVKNGTGYRANTLGYAVGGKTGSSRKLTKDGYTEEHIVANFVGVFPMNNPQIIVYVMVDDPQNSKYKGAELTASNITAPIVSNIIENIAPLLNIIPYIEK
ncbi:MAG: penicillin-binding protein 2 [Rickettsiales bacterium]|nr:MAG: penicillin-binding protein 2 [Rickettsiales bacterium]